MGDMTATKHHSHGVAEADDSPGVVDEARPESSDAGTQSDDSTATGTQRRTRRAVIAGALGIGLVAGGGIWLALPHGTTDPRLPAGFPTTQEVPIAAGEVTTSTLIGSQWQVDLHVDDYEAQLAAIEDLQGAGFALKGQQGSGPIGTVSALSSESHSARVEFGQDHDGNFTVKYVVSESQGAPQNEGNAK